MSVLVPPMSITSGVLVARGHGDRAHDARCRSGENGLGREIRRGLQLHVAAVGFKQPQGHDSPLALRLRRTAS